jgi:hypothetical protein
VRADLVIRENDNYGLQDFIEVGTGRQTANQLEGAADRMRALLHYNVSGLPELNLTSASVEASLLSFDNGLPSSVYTLNAHAITTTWLPSPGEGNGFEGNRPQGASAALTDPDGANGTAWSGFGSNPDPFAANNGSQPSLDPTTLDSQTVLQRTAVTGDVLRWNVTSLVKRWLSKASPNHGIALKDSTTDNRFRSVRLGSREGEIYGLPRAVPGTRLALSWNPGVKPGDLTGDGCVDTKDLAVLMTVVRGQAEAGSVLRPLLDLNADNKTDIADARKLATLFTMPLGAPCR